MTSWRVVLLMLLASLTVGCGENGLYSGTLVTSGQHHLTAGQTIPGELVVLHGEVTLDRGATVAGTVYALDGVLHIDGVVAGDLIVLGGQVWLGPGAVVDGDLTVEGGALHRDPAAVVHGSTIQRLPEGLSGDAGKLSVRGQVIWMLLSTLFVTAVAVVIVHLLPRATDRLSHVIVDQAVVAGALGLLALIVVPALLVFMAFTIILIPVAIVGLALLVLSVSYGLAAAGRGLGERIGERGRRHLRPVTATLVGTPLLITLLHVLGFIPLIGVVIQLSIVAVVLGANLLTGFGARSFVPSDA